MDFDLFSCNYDSPIEELLGEQIGKYIEPDSCRIIPQYEINTTAGLFILDFLIEIKGRKIAIECDGKQYHEYNSDLYRDACLLSENHIDEMIRFRGKDIVSCLNLCMLFLAQHIPGLFEERYIHVFEVEARYERWGKNRHSDPEGEHFYDDISLEDDNSLQDGIRIWGFDAEITYRHKRFHRNYENKDILPDWARAWQYIVQNKITSREEFVEKYSHRWES